MHCDGFFFCLQKGNKIQNAGKRVASRHSLYLVLSCVICFVSLVVSLALCLDISIRLLRGGYNLILAFYNSGIVSRNFTGKSRSGEADGHHSDSKQS